MDDTSVVEGCRRGDRAAQRAFYERYADRIYTLTLRMTARPEDAADLTQETFLRAFQQLPSFDGRSSVGTWLYRIAINETLQAFRRREREQRHLEAFSRVAAASRSSAASGDPPPDRSAGQAGRSACDAGLRADTHGQAQAGVEAALAELSLEHRAVLILKYQTGLDYAEIAEVLDCAPGTVASRLNRARSEMRKLLDNRNEDEEEPRRVGHPIQGGQEDGFLPHAG